MTNNCTEYEFGNQTLTNIGTKTAIPESQLCFSLQS